MEDRGHVFLQLPCCHMHRLSLLGYSRVHEASHIRVVLLWKCCVPSLMFSYDGVLQRFPMNMLQEVFGSWSHLRAAAECRARACERRRSQS